MDESVEEPAAGCDELHEALATLGAATEKLIEHAESVISLGGSEVFLFHGSPNQYRTAKRPQTGAWPAWVPGIFNVSKIADELDAVEFEARSLANRGGDAFVPLTLEQRESIFSLATDTPDPAIQLGEVVRDDEANGCVSLYQHSQKSTATLDGALKRANPQLLNKLDALTGTPWRGIVVKMIADEMRLWPRQACSTDAKRIAFPVIVREAVERILSDNPCPSWVRVIKRIDLAQRQIRALRMESLTEGTVAGKRALTEEDAPYDVDLDLGQIRMGRDLSNVSSEAAQMAHLLLQVPRGEWIAMSKQGFSKPSETLKKLPASVQDLIETSKGKGYRLPRGT